MAKLIINPTSASKREIALSGAVLSIGRDPANDLVLPDTLVSRRHAVVEVRGALVFLRDCNSSNGSLVNGDRVTERSLKDGDLLSIGATRLLFREGTDGAPEPAAKVVQHPNAVRLVCPVCGVEHGVADQFCRQCGGQLVAHIGQKQICPSCGSAVARPAHFCTVCGTTLPQAADPLAVTRPQPALAAGAASTSIPTDAAVDPQLSPSAGAEGSQGLRPAGAGLRLIAAILDACIVSIVQAAAIVPVVVFWSTRAPAGGVSFVPILLSALLSGLALLLGICYYVYFWGVRGATPGKKALGLVVTDARGRVPIGVGAALLRLAGYVLSALPLCVGFVLVPVTGRGLHDRIAGTRVVLREGI